MQQATGRAGDARVCGICRWRDLPPHRPTVCHPCEDRLQRLLRLLSLAAAWLPTIAATEPTPAGQYNLDAAGLAWNAALDPPAGPVPDQIGTPPIATVLGRWANVWGVAADRMPAWYYIRRLSGLLPEVCGWDSRIVAFAAELSGLAASARRAMHRDLRPTRYAAPCPACQQPLLRRDVGDDAIVCAGCGAWWEPAEYTAAAVAALDDEVLLYAHEIGTVLGIKPSTVDTWCWRGLLTATAWDGQKRGTHPDDQGRPMYRLGQARHTAHQVRLRREWLAELIVWRDGDDEPHRQLLPCGSTVAVAGVAEIVLGRGAIVEIGPLDTSTAVDVLEANQPGVADDPKVTVR